LFCAYLYSGLMSLSHLLTFPGAILMGRALVASSEQATAWIFAGWTNGFALLILIAVSLEARSDHHRVPANRAGQAAATALCLVPVAVVIVTTAAVKLELPRLVTGSDFTGLSWMVRWLSIILLGSSIALILFVMREPSDLYLWLSWALAAMVFYTLLSAIGGARFSVGWYVGRSSWLVSAWSIFVYFVLRFSRQFRGSAKVP
jgi:hypothetical protein